MKSLVERIDDMLAESPVQRSNVGSDGWSEQIRRGRQAQKSGNIARAAFHFGIAKGEAETREERRAARTEYEVLLYPNEDLELHLRDALELGLEVATGRLDQRQAERRLRSIEQDMNG